MLAIIGKDNGHLSDHLTQTALKFISLSKKLKVSNVIVLMKNANVKVEGQKGGKKANIKKDIMNLAFFHINHLIKCSLFIH